MSHRRSNQPYKPRHALRDALDKPRSDASDVIAWQDKYIELATFVNDKKRMPSHKDSGAVHELWAWANRQNTSLMLGFLNDEQADAIRAIPGFREAFNGAAKK